MKKLFLKTVVAAFVTNMGVRLANKLVDYISRKIDNPKAGK